MLCLNYRWNHLEKYLKNFPTRDDYQNACAMISVLQESYDLEIDHLAKGVIKWKHVNHIFSLAFIILEVIVHLVQGK